MDSVEVLGILGNDGISVQSVKFDNQEKDVIAISCKGEVEADINLYKSPYPVERVKLEPFVIHINLKCIPVRVWLQTDMRDFYSALCGVENFNMLSWNEDIFEDLEIEDLDIDRIFRYLNYSGTIDDAWDMEDSGAISVEQDCGYISYKFSNSATYNDICAVWNGTNEEIEVVYNRDGVDGYGIEEEEKAEESLVEIIMEKIEEGNEDDIDWNNCFLCVNYAFPIDGEGSVDVERGNIIKFAKDIPELKDYC